MSSDAMLQIIRDFNFPYKTVEELMLKECPMNFGYIDYSEETGTARCSCAVFNEMNDTEQAKMCFSCWRDAVSETDIPEDLEKDYPELANLPEIPF